MKSAKFQYQLPTTIEAAIELLADTDHDVQILAGGQSLMPMMNLRVAQPDVLVDLNSVAGLGEVHVHDNTLLIGAMTRYAALESSALIDQHTPLMAMAIGHIAHPAIRNRGTIGGSAALADPAAEMPALLIALDATIRLRSGRGERSVAANEFFLGMYDTAREPDELLLGFDIPIDKPRFFGFYEIAQRQGDYASAGAAITASESAPFDNLRIVMFGVSDKPERLTDLEAALQGTRHGDDGFTHTLAKSLSGIDYADSMNLSAAARAHHANVALRRAFEHLCNPSSVTSGKS